DFRDSAPRTIVVVDDESGVRSVIAKRLRVESYRVLEAADGEEALAILNREGDAVDLVISDLIMPIKSGAELVSQVSRDFPSIKFIIMSGYLSGDAKQIESSSEQTVFLQKPVRMGELAGVVEVLLKRSEVDPVESD
ncbi:MAG: response regulator, partial [bacterium]|nr:response regulator [bacterium]